MKGFKSLDDGSGIHGMLIFLTQVILLGKN